TCPRLVVTSTAGYSRTPQRASNAVRSQSVQTRKCSATTRPPVPMDAAASPSWSTEMLESADPAFVWTRMNSHGGAGHGWSTQRHQDPGLHVGSRGAVRHHDHG